MQYVIYKLKYIYKILSISYKRRDEMTKIIKKLNLCLQYFLVPWKN